MMRSQNGNGIQSNRNRYIKCEMRSAEGDAKANIMIVIAMVSVNIVWKKKIDKKYKLREQNQSAKMKRWKAKKIWNEMYLW